MLTCYFHQKIEKPPSVSCRKYWKHDNNETVALFSVNRASFFYGSSERFYFSVFICQRTYVNNQPCDQAILGIIEHSSSNRKQIQVKDMAQSHSDMEYKLNFSHLY